MNSCFHFLESTENLIDAYPYYVVFWFIFTTMSFFLTIIGNSIVIYAFWTAPSIAPPSRVFFINLAVSDLLVGLVVLPLSAVYRARIFIRLNNQSNDYDSNLECDITKTVGFFALFLSGVSLNSIAVIAVDRYLGLSLHLRYHELVTAVRALIVVATVWIWSFFMALTSMVFSLKDIVNSSFILFKIVITTCAYIKIYKIARHHQNQIFDEAEIENQNNQLVRFVRASKLAFNSLYIFVIMLICYAPYGIISPFFRKSPNPSPSLALGMSVSISISLCNSCINPLVYCWKIRAVRVRAINLLTRVLPGWNT